MKILASILLFLWLNPQTPGLIQGKGFKGYILGKNQFVITSIENQKERYTPVEEDVLLAERLVKEGLAELNNPMTDQGSGCPVIHRNLKKYIRQYVGYVNTAGEKIIWINFLWKSGTDNQRLTNEVVIVLDGCSHYWNIKVNLNKRMLYELFVNGIA